MNTTNTPTARKASSLISDSKAIASTMPRWCSVTSRLRVPKTMANSASTSDTTSAVSCTRVPVASALAPISRLTPSTMPLSCKAMYGSTPTRQISATTTARVCDLP
ncbi:hypothetical protein D3C76_1453870 [compost metagenome]